MGVIIAFLLAAFVIGWFIGRFIGRLRSAAAEKSSAPVGLLVFGLRRRRGFVGKPRFQLGFDLNEIPGLGLEVARMRPLEARLQHASDLPIGVAEMIVDGWILGLEFDGALQL